MVVQVYNWACWARELSPWLVDPWRVSDEIASKVAQSRTASGGWHFVRQLSRRGNGLLHRKLRIVALYILRYKASEHIFTHMDMSNWASVSEPHTCDLNATFSLYVCYISTIIWYIRSICDRQCTSNNISYTRRARILPRAARRGAVGPTHCWSHCPPGGRAVNLRACALAV